MVSNDMFEVLKKKLHLASLGVL